MSAYEVETSKYDNVQEAIADSFVEGYEVHLIIEAEPDLFYVLASPERGVAQVFEYRVEIFGGMYSMRSCTVDVDDAVQEAPGLREMAEKYGCV